MLKFLWFDTETTGLDPHIHDIIQLSGFIETSQSFKEFNFKIAPSRYDTIDQKAIRIHGIPIKEMRTFPDQSEVYKKIKDLFDLYIDCYNREDKFIPCGQNIDFDIKMLKSLFIKNNDNYLFSYLGYGCLDLKNLVVQYEMIKNKRIFKNQRLSTICEEFNITLQAHDAFSDIKATRECCLRIWKEIRKHG